MRADFYRRLAEELEVVAARVAGRPDAAALLDAAFPANSPSVALDLVRFWRAEAAR